MLDPTRQHILMTMSPWELDLYAEMGGAIPRCRQHELEAFRQQRADQVEHEQHYHEQKQALRELAIEEIRKQYEANQRQWGQERAAAKRLCKSAAELVGRPYAKRSALTRQTRRKDAVREALESYRFLTRKVA